MHRFVRPTLGLLLLLALSMLFVREYLLLPDGRTHVAFLDVGQGDATWITGPSGQQILIDAGPDLSALEGIGARMSFFDRHIDLLVLSHPNLDHLFAFPEILRRYRIGAVLLTGVAFDLPRYREMQELLASRKIPLLRADPARDIDLGDGLRLDVLWPPPLFFGKTLGDDVNNTSIVLKLIYGDQSALFTGDMEEGEEQAVLASGGDVTADVLKVAHHGSRTSSSTGFLLAVRPSLAVISVSRENSYGHPHPWILRRMAHFGIPVRTTAGEGTIEVVMDGRAGYTRGLP